MIEQISSSIINCHKFQLKHNLTHPREVKRHSSSSWQVPVRSQHQTSLLSNECSHFEHLHGIQKQFLQGLVSMQKKMQIYLKSKKFASVNSSTKHIKTWGGNRVLSGIFQYIYITLNIYSLMKGTYLAISSSSLVLTESYWALQRQK